MKMCNKLFNNARRPARALLKICFVFLLTILFGSNYTYGFSPSTGPNPKWFEFRGLSTDYDSILDLAQNHSSSEVRFRAIDFAYYRFRQNPKTADTLFKIAASNSEYRLRVQAGTWLATLRDKRAISVLKDLMKKTDDIKVQLDIAKFQIILEDFSGIKKLIQANKSQDPEVRIYSSKMAKYFFKNRKSILKQFQIDILEEFLGFAKDTESEIRMEFLVFWPGNYPDTLLWPEGGVPERLQRKYYFAVEKIASNDSDLTIREKARRKLKLLQWEDK